MVCPAAMSQLNFDFALGETADALRASVARFAAERIAPRATDIDRDNAFPRDLWPQMGALGLLGITVEAEDGGAGLGYLEHVVANWILRPLSDHQVTIPWALSRSSLETTGSGCTQDT